MRIFRSPLLSGIVSFLLFVAVLALLYRNGLYNKLPVFIAFLVLDACFVTLTIFLYKKATLKAYSFLRALRNGCIAGILYTIAFACWNLLYIKVINPLVYLNDAGNRALREELKSEGLSDDIILKTIQEMHQMLSPEFYFMATLIGGFLLTLVVAIIMAILFKPNIKR